MSVDAQLDAGEGTIEEAWKMFIRSRFDTSDAHGTGRAARVAALDRELQVVQDKMVGFVSLARKNRNAGVLACSLPPEVLSKVFLFASRMPDWRPSISSTGRKYAAGWMAIAHVCEFWREVALNAAILWCEISCFGIPRKAMLPYLMRSKDLPLSLIFLGHRSAHHTSEERTAQDIRDWLCRPLCRRFRRLLVYERGNRFSSRNWPELFEQSMPNLEELLIDVSPPDTNATLATKTLASTLPIHLRHINLKNILIPWESPIWHANLTILTLISVDQPAESLLATMIQFKDLLCAMTSLETLTLENVFPTGDAPLDAKNSTLPDSLRTIHLVANPNSSTACISFFLGVIIPAHAACSIEIHRESVEKTSFLRAIEHLQSNQLPAKSLCLDARSFELAPQDVWSSASKTLPKWHDEIAEGTRRFSYGNATDAANREHVRELFTLLKLSGIFKLAISRSVVAVLHDLGDWHAVLSFAPQISCLSICYEPSSYAILCALADPIEGPDSKLSMPCPELTGLALYHSDVGGQTSSLQLYLSLLGLLRVRQQADIHIQKLALEKEVLTEEEQLRIRPLVIGISMIG